MLELCYVVDGTREVVTFDDLKEVIMFVAMRGITESNFVGLVNHANLDSSDWGDAKQIEDKEDEEELFYLYAVDHVMRDDESVYINVHTYESGELVRIEGIEFAANEYVDKTDIYDDELEDVIEDENFDPEFTHIDAKSIDIGDVLILPKM